jgi:hypothetical protein
MMKGTVIVISRYAGETEDGSYVDNVYFVDIDDFDFDKEFEKYQCKMYKHYGIPVYIEDGVRIKEAEHGKKMELNKKLNAFNREHGKKMSELYFLDEILKAKKIEFCSIFL